MNREWGWGTGYICIEVLCKCVQRVAKIHCLRSMVARVSCISVNSSCTCVTGVKAGAIQGCGKRSVEPET